MQNVYCELVLKCVSLMFRYELEMDKVRGKNVG